MPLSFICSCMMRSNKSLFSSSNAAVGSSAKTGILDVKEEVVVEAVKAAGLTVVEVTHQGEWVSVTARKD